MDRPEATSVIIRITGMDAGPLYGVLVSLLDRPVDDLSESAAVLSAASQLSQALGCHR